jgi:hypothetical protein
LAIGFTAAILSCTAAHAVTITPVAVGGKPAPGTLNHNFDDFTNIHLSDSGILSIQTSAALPNGSDRFTGLWAGTTGSLQLVVREGGQAPGMPAGTTFQFFAHNLHLNVTNDGDIIFGGFTRDPGSTTDRSSTFAGPISSPTLVARDGGPVHGHPGMTYQGGAQFLFPAHIESGRIAFAANAIDPANAANTFGALWEGPINSPAPLLRSNQQVPGLPAGVVFQTFTAARTSLNGSVSFEAGLTGAGVTPENRYSRWAGSNSDPKLVYRRGMQIPGLPAGTLFGDARSDFFHPNNAGQIMLAANLAGTGVTTSNDEGIWLTGGGSNHLVAREGSQAPGLPAGVVFSGGIDPTFLAIEHNNRSDAAFSARISGGASGVWTGQPSNPNLIVRSNDQAPGFPSDIRFGTDFDQISLSDTGQVAFLTSVTGKNDAIFATDGAGNLGYIIGSGDLLHVGDNQFRTVGSLDLFEFNSNNQLAFVATFSDGTSGAFIATVPEPTTLCLLSIGMLLTLHRRRLKKCPC